MVKGCLFSYTVCYNKIQENQHEKLLDACSWFQDNFEKKGCFRKEFKKTPSETGVFLQKYPCIMKCSILNKIK